MLDWFKQHAGELDLTLFTLGNTHVTPLSLLVFTATIIASVLISRLASRAIHRYFQNKRGSAGASYALERIVKLTALILGVMIGIQNIGIDLSALATDSKGRANESEARRAPNRRADAASERLVKGGTGLAGFI